MLEAFLDLYRDILKRKLAGLSDQQIRHPELAYRAGQETALATVVP